MARLTENVDLNTVHELCAQYGIPERMANGIRLYFGLRIPAGNFLSAILRNDLKAAVGAADDENRHLLPQYVSLFYNEAPSNRWGSPDNVHRWLSEANRG